MQHALQNQIIQQGLQEQDFLQQDHKKLENIEMHSRI